jgi:polyisoprenoid-binding protein YceI
MRHALLLLITALALVPATAAGAEVAASEAEVTFRISHPAKQYDASLLPGGAQAIARFDPTDLAATELDMTIDVVRFDSDNSRRDSHMIETMEALIFPTITWQVRGLAGASGAITPGEHQVTATGPLSVHGATRDLSIPVKLVVSEDGTVEASSSFIVLLEEFGIDRPKLVFVPIENEVPVQVRMVFPAAALPNPELEPEPVEEQTEPVEEQAEAAPTEGDGPTAPAETQEATP